jgi:hypothetical protein
MLTFRTSITFAVMAFIVTLAALLIAIQVQALRSATQDAVSAYMDATIKKAFGRLHTETPVFRRGIEFADPAQRLRRDRRIGGLRHLVEASSCMAPTCGKHDVAFASQGLKASIAVDMQNALEVFEVRNVQPCGPARRDRRRPAARVHSSRAARACTIARFCSSLKRRRFDLPSASCGVKRYLARAISSAA